jgi:hypothetical protein
LPNFEEKIDAAIEAKMNAAIASLRTELAPLYAIAQRED